MRLRRVAVKTLAKTVAPVAAILLTTAAALKAQTTTSMELTGVGDAFTVGDVYVDPYLATVGGVANTSIICDDWSNNTGLGQTWTATVISASTLSGGTPMFGSNQPLYNELAWLGSQLLANPKNTTQQAEISFAMWQLTYGVNGTYEENPAPFSYLDEYASADYAGADNYLCEAEGYNATYCSNYKGTSEANYNSAGWEILTPTTLGKSAPQEFMTYVPEPSLYGTLAADLSLFALAVLVLRRRGGLASRRERARGALHS